MNEIRFDVAEVRASPILQRGQFIGKVHQVQDAAVQDEQHRPLEIRHPYMKYSAENHASFEISAQFLQVQSTLALILAATNKKYGVCAGRSSGECVSLPCNAYELMKHKSMCLYGICQQTNSGLRVD